MTEPQFHVMLAFHKNHSEDISENEFNTILQTLKAEKWISGNAITETGYKALEPYKVDNAVIMAAGLSSRCAPLSSLVPKGLFKIKGEALVERQIKQLKEAGIDQIILVAGYLKEQFYYLKDKYGVIIVENDEYNAKNNIHSLYLARRYIKNSYICCSDNYFSKNVFSDYVYDAYYSCKYTEEYIDEFCVARMDGDYIAEIKRGGSASWYTMGEAYFNRGFSARFVELLVSEYGDTGIHKMLMDDYHIRHIDELKLRKKERGADEVQEFDTLKEIVEFDSGFINYFTGFFPKKTIAPRTKQEDWQTKYSVIKRYNAIPTEQRTGRLHLNENLFKPSPKCFNVLKNIACEDVYLYDLSRDDALEVELSSYLQLPVENIFVHNGSAEVIKTILSIALNKDDVILLPQPNWSYYKSVADVKFARCEFYDVKADGEGGYCHDAEGIRTLSKKYRPKMIVITTPHMPTGNIMPQENLEKIISENPDSLILVDEAYLGFSDFEYDIEPLIKKYTNVVFSRTFSKFFGLANMRIGYCVCSADAKSVFGLDLPLFRASIVSRNMAIEALRDKEYYKKIKEEIIDIREWFTAELNKIRGITAYKSYSNFVFVHLQGYDVQKMKDWMESNGILIRLFTEKDVLAMRVTIAPLDIMQQVLALFGEACRITEK